MTSQTIDMEFSYDAQQTMFYMNTTAKLFEVFWRPRLRTSTKNLSIRIPHFESSNYRKGQRYLSLVCFIFPQFVPNEQNQLVKVSKIQSVVDEFLAPTLTSTSTPASSAPPTEVYLPRQVLQLQNLCHLHRHLSILFNNLSFGIRMDKFLPRTCPRQPWSTKHFEQFCRNVRIEHGLLRVVWELHVDRLWCHFASKDKNAKKYLVKRFEELCIFLKKILRLN